MSCLLVAWIKKPPEKCIERIQYICMQHWLLLTFVILNLPFRIVLIVQIFMGNVLILWRIMLKSLALAKPYLRRRESIELQLTSRKLRRKVKPFRRSRKVLYIENFTRKPSTSSRVCIIISRYAIALRVNVWKLFDEICKEVEIGIG